MSKTLTLSSIEKNPNVLYTNTQWLEKTLIKSCEIYKDFIFTIENNPNELKIRKLLSIMNFTKRLLDISIKDITQTVDISNKLSKLLLAEEISWEETSTEDKLKILFPEKINEIAQMDETEKWLLLSKWEAEIDEKFTVINNLSTLTEKAKKFEVYEDKLFSKKNIDRILTSNLALDDKKMFLDKKIETIKANLKLFGIFVWKFIEYLNDSKGLLMIDIKKWEETAITFDQLTYIDAGIQETEDKSSDVINEQRTLLTLLLQKREQLEQQTLSV